MIKEVLRPDPQWQHWLDAVAADAEVGRGVKSGLEYSIYDPEAIGLAAADPLIMGTFHARGADELEVDLFISATVPKTASERIAEICFEGALSDDKYVIARSGETVLGTNQPAIDPEARAQNQEVFRYIKMNLDGYRRSLTARRRRGEVIDPNLKETLRATLGWVALRRNLSPRGNQAYEDFTKAGLVIPGFESEQQVVGLMVTKRGKHQPVGFVYMPERSERHSCVDCGGQIPKNTTRVTVSVEDDTYSDHHHYHPSCFMDRVLPKFVPGSLGIALNPHAREIDSKETRAQS